MRTFLAISPTDEIRQQIERICFGIPQTRWIPPENFHITLKFLGEVGPGAILDLKEMLRSVEWNPFYIRLSKVQVFLKSKMPDVLFLGVDPQEHILDLHSKVEKAVATLGFPLEKKSYTPHLTLSRLPGRLSKEKLQQYLGEFSDFHTQEFEVSSFELYKSTLKPEGPVYEVLETFGCLK